MPADTTSKMRGLHPDGTMSFIGYGIAVIILIGMIPLLPFFLLYLLFDALTSRGRDRGYDHRYD